MAGHASRSRAARRGIDRQCPLHQLGELAWFADVLLPRARPLDDPHPQRVVLVDDRGQHRADVVLGDARESRRSTSGTRQRPGSRNPCRGSGRIFGGTGGFTVIECPGWPAHRRRSGPPALSASAATAAVLVQVLRGQIQPLVRRGHRDADRQQRVAAELEEVAPGAIDVRRRGTATRCRCSRLPAICVPASVAVAGRRVGAAVRRPQPVRRRARRPHERSRWARPNDVCRANG